MVAFHPTRRPWRPAVDDGQGEAKETPARCRRLGGAGNSGAGSRRAPRTRRAGRRSSRPPRAVRRHPSAHRRARRRRPVPDGRRAPRRRPPPRLSPAHADRPPAHAAPGRSRAPGSPVERGARRAGLRRGVRLRKAAPRDPGTGPDRGVAVRGFRAVLVAGHRHRGLHPQRPAVLRRLRAPAARRAASAARAAARGRRGRLGGGLGQPLATDGAGHPRPRPGSPARLAGRAAPPAATARRGPGRRGPALRVDGLAVAAGAVHQLLRPHRELGGVLVLLQPGGLQRRRRPVPAPGGATAGRSRGGWRPTSCVRRPCRVACSRSRASWRWRGVVASPPSPPRAPASSLCSATASC